MTPTVRLCPSMRPENKPVEAIRLIDELDPDQPDLVFCGILSLLERFGDDVCGPWAAIRVGPDTIAGVYGHAAAALAAEAASCRIVPFRLVDNWPFENPVHLEA